MHVRQLVHHCSVTHCLKSLQALPRNSLYCRVGLFPELLRSFSYTKKKKSDFFLCSGAFKNIKDRRSLMFV